jgi:hypothetical protein
MNTSFSTSGLKALFRYPLQGKEWGRKMLYLALFFLGGFFIPVIPWLFAFGYIAEILRRTATNDGETDLPEWKDWNRLLLDGVKMLGAVVVVVIPILIIIKVGILLYLGGMITGTQWGDSGQDILAFISIAGGMTVLFCSMALGMLFSFFWALLSGPALTHMTVKRSFAALFHVREWWKILRANLGGYLIALFLILSIGFAVQYLTMTLAYSFILCGIVPLLVIASVPYTGVLTAVLLGQAYREGVGNLEVLAVPPQGADGEI